MFEEELKYYKENRDTILEHHENQFVIIKGSKFIGAFTTEQEAYEAGLKELGNVPFLIKRASKEEEIIRFPALAIGVVNANT